VVALCRRMTSANACGKVALDSCGWYMFVSLCSLALRLGEIKRPSGACSSTESKEVGWDVISNAPVGTPSRSGLIGWVV
jgi:hypothetical protein